MGAARPSETTRAIAFSLALVVAPNVLGLLAKVSALVLRRFSSWWPPTGLELLPLGVAGLVVLATAYALATRGSRMRSAGLAKRRRFLPPLDLLLLQLGNATFLAFAIVLAIVTLGLLSAALRVLVGQPWLVADGLMASLAVAAVVALFALRRGSAGTRSWRDLRRRWWRRAAVLGIAVGGFWLVGAGTEQSLLEARVAGSQIERPALAGLYALLCLPLVGGALAARFERSGAPRAWSTSPLRWLPAASLLTWLAYLGFLTLYLNGALLTLRGHLAGG